MTAQTTTPVPASAVANAQTGLLKHQPATTTGYSLGALVLVIEIILRAFGVHYTTAQHDASLSLLMTYGPAIVPVIGGYITKWHVYSPATVAVIKRDLAVTTDALNALQGATVTTASGEATVTTTVTPTAAASDAVTGSDGSPKPPVIIR